VADGQDLAAEIARTLRAEDGRVERGGSSGLRDLLQRCLDYVESPLQMHEPATLGTCLRRLREIQGLTMSYVARALDVTVTQVSNWELDREPMSVATQQSYVAAVFSRRLGADEARVQELLEKNTALVLELRQVDRQRMVREFHTVVVGHTLPERPEIPPDPILRRQMRLITEEYLELMEAAYGPDQLVAFDGRDGDAISLAQELRRLVDNAPFDVNFPELLDATVDLDYVVEGMRNWCGINSRAAWALVHAANMAKAGGPRRESDGKMLKPPGWKPPDLAAEIERQKAEAKLRMRGPK
jgi:predicted HAD superfamily Cof-like phosphohydrolase/DNA-binding transcriptional regulator YiaG